jgi:hypothetical protein
VADYTDPQSLLYALSFFEPLIFPATHRIRENGHVIGPVDLQTSDYRLLDKGVRMSLIRHGQGVVFVEDNVLDPSELLQL